MAEIIYNPAILGADIHAVDTSVQITGSAGGIVDILVNGYTFEVGCTGTIPGVSDVKFVPLVQSGGTGYSWGLWYHHVPSDTYPTMKNHDRLKPSLITNLGGLDWAFTYDHLFLYGSLSGDYWITQIHMANKTGKVYMPQDPFTLDYDKVTGWFVIYDDNTIYTIEMQDNSSTEIELRKVNFCDNPITSEILYSIDEPIYHNGDPYNISSVIWMIHYKYDDMDYIVIAMIMYNDVFGTNTESLRFIIYDIDADSTTDTMIDFSSPNHEWWLSSAGWSTPSIFENKIIFVTTPDIDDVYEPLPATACPCPVFVINCTTKAVTRTDSYQIDPTVDWLDIYAAVQPSAIDYTAENFYFVVWKWADHGYALYKFDISSSTIWYVAPLGAWDDGVVTLHQGNPNCYGVNRDTFEVVSIPGLSTIATLTNLFLPQSCVLDVANGRIWNILETNGNFEGVSLFGDPIEYVTVDWQGGTIPFTYSAAHSVYIKLLAGKIVLYLYSHTPSAPYFYQRDIYVLAYTCG